MQLIALFLLFRISFGSVKDNEFGYSSQGHSPDQISFSIGSSRSNEKNVIQKLNGQFLSLTDLHPDPNYCFGSPVSTACHNHSQISVESQLEANWNPNDTRLASYWGTKTSVCDSPLTLINTTFEFLSTHFSNSIDFIISTGDFARHDLDEVLPRSLEEIFGLNRMIVNKLEETFEGVPAIFTYGNNDVFPHNVMPGGSTNITREYSKIWSISEEEKQEFILGGFFTREVSKDFLLISLNTLHFFNLNSAVNGCSTSDDPGSLQFIWLENTLSKARSSGQQVWLVGHVPPTDWYQDCFQSFGGIVLKFQDTILGSIYGHTNLDSFSFISTKELSSPLNSSTFRKSESYQEILLTKFKSLPSSKKLKEGDFSIFNGQPSIIPSYQPSFRVWSYNNTTPATKYLASRKTGQENSPARTNRYLTPLGYVQYYLDLNRVNQNSGYGPGKEGKRLLEEGGIRPMPKWSIEYTTYTERILASNLLGYSDQALLIPLELLSPKIQKLISSSSSLLRKLRIKKLGKLLKEEGLLQYEMKDLTIGSWLNLARDLGTSNKKWQSFLKNMIVSTK